MISGSWPGDLYWFQRKNNGPFAEGQVLKHENGKPITIGRATAVAAGDWNGDGHADLVVGEIEGKLVYLKGTGQTTFSQPEPLSAGSGLIREAGDAGPCLADWNGDGLLDLIVGSGSGSIALFENTGSRTEPKLGARIELLPANQHPERSCTRSKPAVADWNGDGNLDLLVGDFASLGSGAARTTHGWVWVYLRDKPAAISSAK